MVATVGFAPTTPRFSDECSDYLSYVAVMVGASGLEPELQRS